MRTSSLLVLGLAVCVATQHNNNNAATPQPPLATTTERDFDAMSLFSLLEEVMNDSGPTAYAYDEQSNSPPPSAPASSSSSHDYEEEEAVREPALKQQVAADGGHVYNDAHKNTNVYDYEKQKNTNTVKFAEPEVAGQGYVGQKTASNVHEGSQIPLQGYSGQKTVLNVHEGSQIPVQGYIGQKTATHVNQGSQLPVQGFVGQKTAPNVHEASQIPAQGYVGQKTASIVHEGSQIPVQAYSGQKIATLVKQGSQIPVQGYVGQKTAPNVHEGSQLPVQGYSGQKVATLVNQGSQIPVQAYVGQKTDPHVHEGSQLPTRGHVGQKTATHSNEGAKIPVQGYLGQQTATLVVDKESKTPTQVKSASVLVEEDPKTNEHLYEKSKAPSTTNQEPKIASQESVEQKSAASVHRDEPPKIVAQEYVQKKAAAVSHTHEEPKVTLREHDQEKTATNTVEGSKIVAQEYVQQKQSAQHATSKAPTNVHLQEDASTTTTQKQMEPKATTTVKYVEPKTTTPVYVDSEPMPLANYRMPVHYTFNNGQPFYLEKDPVTGDIDFESKKLQLQNIPASPKSDDYFYDEEEIDGDGIDRKDGKILTSSYVDKNNPFNNLPLSYNDFKKVNDYSNHNQKYSDFPLISSSYANTKVQGTAGEKLMNHKPYATSSTHSPSYYTMKPKASTTAATPYGDDYDDQAAKTPSYGDKIPKKPAQGAFNNQRPAVGDKTSGSDLESKRPSLHANTQRPSTFGVPQTSRRPVVDALSEETAKVQTVYSKRPTEDSGYGSQFNKEPIADRPDGSYGFESPLNNKKPTSSETTYLLGKKTTSRPIGGFTSDGNYPSTTQKIPPTTEKTQTTKVATPPPRGSSFIPESSLEENHHHVEDYEYYDSHPDTPAQNFVTPQNVSEESLVPTTQKDAPQHHSSTTESTDLNSSHFFNTEFNIQHISARPTNNHNTEPTPSAAASPQLNSHSGYEVVEDVEVEPASVTTSTSTRRPLVGSIVYAETDVKTSTFPSLVYSESATRLPGNIVTSMPLGTSFQFNRPNTGSQFLHPTRQDSKPAGSNFVKNVEANTGGTFINQGGQKESAYGIFGEEPFRPIFGPGDKSAEGLQINPGQNLVAAKIPQETPNRWNYPNAPVNPESFFQMKTEKTEVPPRIAGVEPPFKKPAPFAREPVNGHGGNPQWGSGNSQQLFQVSTHVKFPAEPQETTDNIAEEGNTAPPTFKHPQQQRPDVYQTIPQRHYQQVPVRAGSVPSQRPNLIPDSSLPPRIHYSGGPKRPIDESFDRETGIPTVPSREAVVAGPQRPGDGFPVRGAPVAAFNILLKEVGHPQKPGGGENTPTRVQGSSVNVPLRENSQRPTFPLEQGQNLNIPIGVNIVNVGGAQGPNQSPTSGEVTAPASGSTTKDEATLPGEIPNLPLTEMEGSPPFMNEPAGMLQPPRPVWDRTDGRPRPPSQNPNQFYRKPFPPNRRHGPNNLPNILPQFRPNAKVSHHEGNRIGYFPQQRQPLLERQRPVSEHLIPPPSRLRNRNDNVDELMAYDAYHQSPPGPILRRPFVHRRAGPHVDHHNPRPQTLQMIQQFPRQPQPPRENSNKDPERPVFVVYPSSPGSKPGNIGKPNPDKEVVVGIRGPHLPVPPANLGSEEDIMSAIPYQHNRNQTPLLQPVKERTDRPILALSPVKNDFPYALVAPEENAQDESEEDNTEVAKSSIDETIEAEVYNNHPPNHEDSEINVIPYLQDYMPFATRKPIDPASVSENRWPYDRRPQLDGKILNKASLNNASDEHISVTLKTISTSSSSPPVVGYVPTTSTPFRITDYPRPGSSVTVEKGSAHHKTVVASEGSEFTLSAVMHTVPQTGGNKRKDSLHVVHAVSSTPNLHLPQNHNNGENIAANQNFQAPFMASVNVNAATPLSQGWNILNAHSNDNDERMKPGTVDKADLDLDDSDRKEVEIAPAKSSENPNFDFENFKPQLFGGFKPIYSVPEESAVVKRPQATEREEKKLT